MIWPSNRIETHNIPPLMDLSAETHPAGREPVALYKVLSLKLPATEVFTLGVTKVRMSVCGVDIKFFKQLDKSKAYVMRGVPYLGRFCVIP